MERMMGIEPTCFAWEANILPLNYIRMVDLRGIEPLSAINTQYIYLRC